VTEFSKRLRKKVYCYYTKGKIVSPRTKFEKKLSISTGITVLLKKTSLMNVRSLKKKKNKIYGT